MYDDNLVLFYSFHCNIRNDNKEVKNILVTLMEIYNNKKHVRNYYYPRDDPLVADRDLLRERLLSLLKL